MNETQPNVEVTLATARESLIALGIAGVGE